MIVIIFKTIATSGFQCTKFVFGRGSTPEPTGGAFTALPRPPSCFKQPTSEEREGRNVGKVDEKG